MDRRSTGTPILGGITSPGNSPFAITVGALDTKGTIDRSDDAVATYSSRGPTKFDFAVKPDVVAPGTAQVSLENPASWLSGRYRWLARRGERPQRLLPVERHEHGGGGRERRRGAAARQRTRADAGASEAGAADGRAVPAASGPRRRRRGSVDFSASQRLAQGGLVGSLLTNLTNTLGLTGGASFRDHGSLIERIYDRTGIRLLSLLDLQALLGDPDGPEVRTC